MSAFMSFLTLGLTADAAAAHRHEFSSAVPSSPSPNYNSMGSQTSRNMAPLTPLSTIPSESSRRASPAPVTPAPVTPAPPISRPEPTPKTKTPRPRTSYHLAPPPPSSHRNRIRAVVRPNRSLILQIQRLHASARPVPSFDIIPALAFATKPKRKRPLGLNGLGMNDFVVLSSEQYAEQGDEDDGEEDLSSRSVIALISPKRERDDESIIASFEMAGGAVWEASQKSNGSYEFIYHQSNGEVLMARWIARTANARRRSSQAVTPVRDSTSQQDKKFQFSMINAKTRRHPILATMTGQRIDVFDQYSVPANISSRPNSPSGYSRMDTMSTISQSGDEEERIEMQTDDNLKTLIILTGSWLALREGFNGRSWFDEPCLTPTTPVKAMSSAPVRFTPSTPVRPSFSSKPSNSNTQGENSSKVARRHSDIGSAPGENIRRRSTLLAHQVTTGNIRIVENESGTSSSARRAHSTGSTFKRPVRVSASPYHSQASSTQPSPVSTRPTTPNITNPSSVEPNNSTTEATLPAKRHKHFHRSSVSAPGSPSDSPSKPKMGWKRLSLPKPATVDKPDERRTLKQKLSRAFSFLRKSANA
ncbi:hypothetical protein DFH27DRAFT_607802 [Peziza echinospora]|nr:hypothetical protein DFH27DRAFT_607802 [Peziza echinospora]